MKIYSKGINGDRIDFIAERKLKGYISPKGDFAVVTVADDTRNIQVLCAQFGIEDTGDFFEFFFSPTKIVSGLKYLLVSDIERAAYQRLIEEFQKTFYDYVITCYKTAEKITRAEAVRIVWGVFNGNVEETLEGVDQKELNRLLASVSISEDEAWICDKFLALIIKYSVHILMWEKKYVYGKAHQYLLQKDEAKQDETMEDGHKLDLRTVKKDFLFLFHGMGERKYKQDKDYIIQCFSENVIKDTTEKMQKEIYSLLDMDFSESIEDYCDFFCASQKADMKETRKESYPVSLYGFLLFVNYFYYKKYADDKKERFEYLLDVSEHIGDITDIIVDTISSATEIVLMLTCEINGYRENDLSEDIFAKRATVIQIDVLAIIDKLMPKTVDAIDVNAIMETVGRELNDEFLTGTLKRIAESRIRGLKDKDKANIVGSVYMYASSYEDVKEGTEYLDVQTRARDEARHYWENRKNCFKKHKKELFHHVDMKMVEKVFSYLAKQNLVYRKRIRSVLDEYMNSM